jgi:hypothetical protein
LKPPRVHFEFDEHPGLYFPGDVISGVARIETSEPEEVKAVEVSVLWYTLGKGEEDMAVHYFTRETAIEGARFDPLSPRRFETRLPNSPLSYDGLIVRICWCVRVRVFYRGGREFSDEQPFQLGATPRPVVLEPESEIAEPQPS